MLEPEEVKPIKAEHQDMHQCEQCGKEFKERGQLNSHIKTHMKFKCQLCKSGGYSSIFYVKFQTQEELDEHLRNHEDIDKSNQKECEECGRLFLNEKEYSDHQLRGTSKESTELVCPYKDCERTFRFTCGLNKHKRHDHGHDKHICKEPGCGKTFTQWSGLRKHQRSHSGLKPYNCDECNMSFAHKDKLKDHKMRHAGIKSFICETCSKGFFTRDKLKRHIRTHTGERPFECAECFQTFIQKKDLNNHMKRHNNAAVSLIPSSSTY